MNFIAVLEFYYFILFLIYVNDISDSLSSLTRLFADDSSPFFFLCSIVRRYSRNN